MVLYANADRNVDQKKQEEAIQDEIQLKHRKYNYCIYKAMQITRLKNRKNEMAQIKKRLTQI